MTADKHLTYITYLRVDELLQLQKPLSEGPEHDELLFITIHQVYELWFKQILHEVEALQISLERGDTHRSLSLLTRIRAIMKTCVSQLDILETMTPLQFNSFRDRLSSASGFQSAQFRELEAVLGRRDPAGQQSDKSSGMGMSEHLAKGSDARNRVEMAMNRKSLWHSAMKYFNSRSPMPDEAMNVDPSVAWEPNKDVQQVLIKLHREDPEANLIGEALTDFDEGLQEWRYRHVKMVERTIGRKVGTGGSSGVDYLSATLFNPVFPDLWEIRSQF